MTAKTLWFIRCTGGGIGLALMLVTITTQARVYSPRVLSEHHADAYSMKTFAEYPRWANLQGDTKAWELFAYLSDYDTGLYPMGIGAFETNESLYEYSLVRDPVKLLNVYGLGYCDVFGPVMAGIWEDAGLGTARVVDLPLIDHVASEVFYEGSWHYLDLDLRAAFRANNGFLHSLQDARVSPALWNRPNNARFFPLDSISEMQRSYTESDVINRYGVHQSGHSMDYVLRQGETFTRWWQPQGGRWLHHSNYAFEPSITDLIESTPRGPKSKHESFTRHTHGNGRFVYSPDLTANSTDFADGVYDAQNVSTSAEGLTLSQSGSGFAVFEVRTPYVIVPIVGNTATVSDDYDASVITIDATGVSYSISVDNGVTWESVSAVGSRIDLTRQVAGRYGYLFRVQLDGVRNQAIVRSLNMSTWVQLAPASLPSLRAGSNRLEFRTGDHYGLNTRVVEITPDTADANGFFRHLVVEPETYFPDSPTSRIRSPFVLAAEAPPQSKVAWFSAGGSFETYQLESAPFTEFTMAYAVDVPFSYNNFYSASIPADMEHWHSNAQKEVVLSEAADVVYLQYQGTPAVNTVGIYLHVLDQRPYADSVVNINHQWYDGDQLMSYSATSEDGVYFVDAGDNPENVSIELSVDSVITDSDARDNDTNESSSSGEAVSVGSGEFHVASLTVLFLLFGLRRRIVL